MRERERARAHAPIPAHYQSKGGIYIKGGLSFSFDSRHLSRRRRFNWDKIQRLRPPLPKLTWSLRLIKTGTRENWRSTRMATTTLLPSRTEYAIDSEMERLWKVQARGNPSLENVDIFFLYPHPRRFIHVLLRTSIQKYIRPYKGERKKRHGRPIDSLFPHISRHPSSLARRGNDDVTLAAKNLNTYFGVQNFSPPKYISNDGKKKKKNIFLKSISIRSIIFFFPSCCCYGWTDGEKQQHLEMRERTRPGSWRFIRGLPPV